MFNSLISNIAVVEYVSLKTSYFWTGETTFILMLGEKKIISLGFMTIPDSKKESESS